jgi:hypothetical protein
MRAKAVVAALSLAALSALAVLQTPAPPPSPASLLPAGALLVLEAKDFSALLRDWNASPEKDLWLKSDNYQVFSRSRLFLRLAEAQEEFAGVAGLAPDMALLNAVAGGESALAIYDIGALEFLYITRMPTAAAVETALWQKRADYTPRNAGGKPFFVRTDAKTRRSVAFAATDDYLLLGTRDDLLAGALQLMAGSGTSVRSDRWYDQAVRAASAPGELRLTLNMEGLLAAPHFRSYWIQRNASELRPYRAAVVDMVRAPGEIREERVFLPIEDAASAQPSAVNEVLALVPGDAGLYQAWARPSAAQAAQALGTKILAPRQFGGTQSEGGTGDESNLETLIDEAPLDLAGERYQPAALVKLLESARLDAMLQFGSSRALPGGVFIGHETAIVLLAAAPWEAAAVRAAIAQSVERMWTTAGLGVKWAEQRDGFYTLDGLARVAVAARGRQLIVAGAPLALGAAQAQPVSDEVYVAGFRHTRESANFVRMMRMIERPAMFGEERQPLFFAENLGSLSQTLARVESASVVVRATGRQTVVYKLR